MCWLFMVIMVVVTKIFGCDDGSSSGCLNRQAFW